MLKAARTELLVIKLVAYNLTSRLISSYNCDVVFFVDFCNRQRLGKMKARKCSGGRVIGFSSLETTL